MTAKILISGEANTGKTSLIRNLKDSFVISHDGKNFPFGMPHTLVKNFDSTASLVALVTEKMNAYKEKFKAYPKIVVFDSVSKIIETMETNCRDKNPGDNSFKVWSNLDKEITTFNSFIQNQLIGSGISVIVISHAIFDEKSNGYKLVAKGSFAKRGAYLAEVDEAIGLEVKGKSRTVHFRSVDFLARSLQESFPDKMEVDEFDINNYVQTIVANEQNLNSYQL